MKDLISIIIPVYNVEKYIDKCLDTVINQTYNNLEIILIDDGSTDNSGKICDNYAKNDSRIKVFHKKNGGSSSARNYGIEHATGSYIGFIDSDDYIDYDMYESLYNACIKNNCDIAWCDKYLVKSNGKTKIQKYSSNAIKLSKEETYKLTLLNDCSLCDKLFKTEIFNDIRFVEGSLYEDIMPLCYAINKCNSTYYIGMPKYYYLQRDGSNVHHFDSRKLDYKKNAKLFYEFVLSNFPNLKEVTDSYYILVLSTLLSELYLNKRECKHLYNDILSEFKLYKKIYRNNNYISFSKKIMCFLMMNGMVGFATFIKNIRNKFL